MIFRRRSTRGGRQVLCLALSYIGSVLDAFIFFVTLTQFYSIFEFRLPQLVRTWP